uniref:Uncharacterized protein n=1 Tax=Arundo donax TaxID=35708 RepID=A0A0A9CWG3_ARUDO
MKLQKQNADNGQTSSICAVSRDQCSNEHSNTEAISASTSHNNEPASVQKALCTHPDATASLSTKTEQITPDRQRETAGQPNVCILYDASCDQKACEKPLQELQLEPDGALTDSGKDIPAAAFPICNGDDGLLGPNEQDNEALTDAFCKPTPDIDTTTNAQVILTADTVVSNGTISSNEDLSSGNEAKEIEPVKQHDELVVVKELSARNIDDKVNAEEQVCVLSNTLEDGQALMKELSVMDTDHMSESEEQASVLNNILEDGQALVKELSVMDTDHMAEAEEQAPVLNNRREDGQALVKELSVAETDHVADAEEQTEYGKQTSSLNDSLDIGQVNSEKKISSIKDCACGLL